MKTAYIFHDSFTEPFNEWYPWMRTSLEKMGYLVVVPKFPTPAGQSYESWKVVIKNYIATFDSETLFIGHGTGALFAMRLTQEAPVKIRGLFIIAGYGEPTGNIGFDRVNKPFYEPALDWEKLRSNASIIRIFAGEGDPFVPTAITERLADNLGEVAEIIPQGGHLGKAAGFSELIPVLGRIQESLAELDRTIAIESGAEGTAEVTPIEITSIDQAVQEMSGIHTTPKHESTHETIKKSENSSTKSSKSDSTTSSTTSATTDTRPTEEPVVHTMYQDLTKIVSSNRGHVTSSLLTRARIEKAEKENISPASGKNIIYTILSVITLAAALGIIIFLIQKYAPTPVAPVAPEVPSLIQAEDHQKITFGNEPSFILDQKIKNVLAQPATDGTIRDIYYMTNGGRASFTSLLKTLDVADLPEGLTAQFPESENGLPVFMHGLSLKNQVARHFLVIRVSSYDTAFSLMKEWEPRMARNLGSLMNISSDFLRTKLSKDVFTDELIQNKNVRVLRYHKSATISFGEGSNNASTSSDMGAQVNAFANTLSPYQEGDLMIAYFFLNEKTVVIIDNLDLIPDILKRYANRQIYQ